MRARNQAFSRSAAIWVSRHLPITMAEQDSVYASSILAFRSIHVYNSSDYAWRCLSGEGGWLSVNIKNLWSKEVLKSLPSISLRWLVRVARSTPAVSPWNSKSSSLSRPISCMSPQRRSLAPVEAVPACLSECCAARSWRKEPQSCLKKITYSRPRMSYFWWARWGPLFCLVAWWISGLDQDHDVQWKVSDYQARVRRSAREGS